MKESEETNFEKMQESLASSAAKADALEIYFKTRKDVRELLSERYSELSSEEINNILDKIFRLDFEH